MRLLFFVGLALVSGACFANRENAGPRPDATSTRWRALLGCYRMMDGQFVLDSTLDVKASGDWEGVRLARFWPPAINAGFWYVTEKGAVWVLRHDGLWGRSMELAVRGDSLVGRAFVFTDAIGEVNPPVRALAIRTDSCRAELSSR